MKKHLSRLLDGLIFGLGFSISLTFVFYGASFLLFPLIESHTYTTTYPEGWNETAEIENTTLHEPEPFVSFSDLSLEEKIESSSVIILTEYKTDDSGAYRAIIKEFLKKEDDTVFHYDVGDEYSRASIRTIRDDVNYGTGAVVFLSGNPANMKMTTSYFGDSLFINGDIPISKFKEMCEKN